jgi:RNA polymerase sigma-70 factor (ECF subfamily)
MRNGSLGIWEQVHERLRAFIGKRVRNEAQTDDLLQEVFLRVHRHLERLEEPDRMVSWVFRITRNAIIDHYRSAERRREWPAGLAADIEQHEDELFFESNNAEAKAELTGCLRPMIGRLPEDYREAIRLVELEGLTHQEAATKLGISVPGMKSRVQRARKQLCNMLNDCCLIELDSRRGVVEYELRRPDAC